jgi:protoporphyrinogen oxidase
MTSTDTANADGAPKVVVIGAGPAGLTAAYELMKAGHTATILESDDVVGGISRTVERDGWRFDIGGHRFFTKVKPVDDLWWEILGAENFLRRPRMSRIYYRGKLIDYPLKPLNALRALGPVEAVRCVASYLWVRVKPPKNQHMLEGFYAARFGWRLYGHFFKTYNEKVWGVPTSEMSADFGAQRVKELSLFRAVWEAMKPKKLRLSRDKSKQVTSLIEEFNYPKYGPGQMWEVAADKVTAAGTSLRFRHKVVKVRHHDDAAHAVVALDKDTGTEHTFECTHVISSMPMSRLLQAMDPPVPEEVRAAADALTYRDFMTVALVVPMEYSFPDTWIYIHDPDVKVGRVQNFGSWSPYMVKEGRTCLGLEFFVNEGDQMWTKSDEDLIEQAKREMHHLGLVKDVGKVEAGYVVRVPKAYPVYDEQYQDNVKVLRRWLEQHASNVFPTGRNGMHKYNNQDHSMLTAMLSVENILGAHHDVWTVNVEAEYHEEQAGSDVEPSADGSGGTGRDAPVLPREAIDAAAQRRTSGAG